jgi:hypothetical protein
MMAQIKEQLGSSAKELNQLISPTTRSSPRIGYRSNNMFFLNLRTADPSISEKIFGPESTAIFYAIPALHTLTHSVVR